MEAACVWEACREGRRLHLRAGLEGQALGAERRVSAARDSHAGAALESGLHVIVDDWESESRFSMPPALRVLGVRSSLAVPIDGKERPFGVLDIHSLEPSRFTPQDVHFVQASANVLADASERHTADHALRHRVLHDSLTGLPNRLSFVDSLQGPAARHASGSPVGILFLDLDTSSGSTTASATTPATSCCARWRRGCAPTCARATPSPASAATSSAS